MKGRNVGATVAFGALCGLAWAASFRAVMSEFAGSGSSVAWLETFAAILLPGVIVGGLLGWAHTIRLSGGRRRWRWLGAAPAAFAIAPMLLPDAILALLTQGLGGGAIAVALLAIGGGFAISGRGRLTARIVCGVLSALLILGVTLTTFDIAGPRLAMTEARGVWVALLAFSLLTVLAIASSIPFRPVVEAHPDEVRDAESEQRNTPTRSGPGPTVPPPSAMKSMPVE
ncbi:hypothetical protein [Cryobacterium mannosilyticum]|uniref:Uncharacterized protein n=1 Tax=Cryobacterium mannosilyticum TaxID=1259190 RepID=A0A4R8WF91_9MICO|nr:hypothetical protein [Cryobacterium mannosilyticum]TFC06358.1 hypothetical protein E3O32_04555 [Cryobacterium mannosilyticum]